MINTARVGSIDEFEHVLSNITGNTVVEITANGNRPLIERLTVLEGAVFDFDDTLSTKNTWSDIRKTLRVPYLSMEEDDLDRHLMRLRDPCDHLDVFSEDWWQRGFRLANLPTIEGAWLARCFDRFIQAGVHLKDLEVVGQQMPLREGSKLLLKLFAKKIIVSFGIAEVIRACLHHNDMRGIAIAATSLHADEQTGAIVGYNEDTLVTTATKKVVVDGFLETCNLEPEVVLAIGDSIFDIDMMPEGGCNIMIFPTSETGSKKMAAMRGGDVRKLWGKLSAIVIGDSLLPLHNMIVNSRL
ncbi:MAG: hypothetical protein ABIH21_04590 [Patescibacteria group bacterium]